MQDLTHDLLAEYRDLAALCETLTPAQWQQPGDFYGWTPWDEVAHLCYFDETGLQSATDAPAFGRDAARLVQRLGTGQEISAIARERYAGLDGPALLQHWRSRHEALVAALAALDPKARLAWYGPPMSARSFASARLMETWAHGQDIWDLVPRRRPQSMRLQHIAHLGATTFNWTFVNRRLPVPAVPPFIELTAPDGTLWCWNAPSADCFVRGTAQDFCLLVTQRRHLDDTALTCAGAGIRDWLLMAQCFAGPPADGPAAGARAGAGGA
jgi:uncharacterized protein (TIGR03084 family)